MQARPMTAVRVVVQWSSIIVFAMDISQLPSATLKWSSRRPQCDGVVCQWPSWHGSKTQWPSSIDTRLTDQVFRRNETLARMTTDQAHKPQACVDCHVLLANRSYDRLRPNRKECSPRLAMFTATGRTKRAFMFRLPDK